MLQKYENNMKLDLWLCIILSFEPLFHVFLNCLDIFLYLCSL